MRIPTARCWVLLSVVVAASHGCERPGSDDANQPRREAPAQTASSHALPALHAAWERAIVRPTAGDATWSVDPFVASYLHERLALEGSQWLEPTASPEEPGYRVTAAFAADPLARALGLRVGDRIEALNGRPLRDADDGREALRDAANAATLSISRDRLLVTHRYVFRPGLAWEQRSSASSPEMLAESDPQPDPEAPTPSPDPTPASPPSPAPTPSSAPSPTPTPSSTPSPGTRPGTPSPATPRPDSRPRPSAPKPPVVQPPRPSPTSSVTCSSSTQCSMTRAELQALVASPERTKAQLKIVPAIRDDVFSGYKLKAIPTGSTAHRLGFRPEDKITHVNGSDLTDDAQALALYLGLASTRVFRIRYERGGKAMTKTVVIEG